MDLDTFQALFAQVRNWGRWGDDDERGTLNHVTPAHVVAAAALVRDGFTVSLAHDIDTTAGPDNGKPALHYMTRLADVGGGEPQVNMDFIGMDFHGKSVTHLDAVCHVNFQGQLYNGVQAESALSSAGSSFGSVLALGDGIVSRGVLLDVPRHRGVDWLEPGDTVRRVELEEVAAGQGIRLTGADIVLVRTGARRRRDSLGAWDPSSLSAGVYPDVLEWLHENDSCLLGSDGDSDTRPSPVEDVESPVHALALSSMGMPLMDNLNLERLASTCERLGRSEFHCAIAPLRVPGGTGSPVNPLATF